MYFIHYPYQVDNTINKRIKGENFIPLKQRKTGDLNQRFEPPVNLFYAIFQSLFKHLFQLVFKQNFKHEIRLEK